METITWLGFFPWLQFTDPWSMKYIESSFPILSRNLNNIIYAISQDNNKVTSVVIPIALTEQLDISVGCMSVMYARMLLYWCFLSINTYRTESQCPGRLHKHCNCSWALRAWEMAQRGKGAYCANVNTQDWIPSIHVSVRKHSTGQEGRWKDH